MTFNWLPLWLSLRVAGVATAGALLPGLWVAWLLATREFTGKRTILVILMFLLAAPAMIVAWILLRPALAWETGAALGVVAALPLIALGARGPWKSLDGKYGNAARSVGATEWRIFWRIVMPLGWRPVLAAAAAAFARVMIEWTIVARL